MAENRRHTEYYKDTRREEKKPITPTPTEFNPKRKKNNNYYNITEMGFINHIQNSAWNGVL